MLSMGIDGSTKATGYCILDNETKEIVKSGVIKLKDNISTEERIEIICEELKSLFREYELEYINIEDMVVFTNFYTIKVLSGLLYCIVLEARKTKAIVNTVKPSEWRKGKIKGKYKSDLKANAIMYVKEKYNKKVTDDEAEAIIIAEYEV